MVHRPTHVGGVALAGGNGYSSRGSHTTCIDMQTSMRLSMYLQGASFLPSYSVASYRRHTFIRTAGRYGAFFYSFIHGTHASPSPSLRALQRIERSCGRLQSV